jgi:hypothetical protein
LQAQNANRRDIANIKHADARHLLGKEIHTKPFLGKPSNKGKEQP